MIGRGGSSDVYMAEHIKLKTIRAIKRIKKDHILHEQLLNEASILKNLRHTCIPIIYDFEEDDHYSYIIEQYIKGDSLPGFRKQWLGIISEEVIVDIGVQICDLLQYLYSLENPILYLDLQPNNIIISDQQVKLIDFGASVYKNKLNDRRYQTATKGFAAPELYGEKEPDERADIYGVGALLYYMVTGVSYQSKTLLWDKGNKSFKAYDKQLLKIIKTCLNSNLFFRYSSIDILKNKLLALNNKGLKKLKSPKSYTNHSEPIQIAIAGAQSRIGTTHLSFLITSYLNRKGISSIYIETNNSKHVYKILEQQKNIRLSNGIYKVKSSIMLPSYKITLPIDISKYKIHIRDYGTLDQTNINDFLEGDIKACILGAKDWELMYTENAIKLLSGQKSIKYLFSFLDSESFMDTTSYLQDLPCYRIPYEPNIHRGAQNSNIIEFMEGFLNY